MEIIIKRKDLEKYMKECKEFEAIQIDIYENEEGKKQLEITGLDCGGMGSYDLEQDPIEEMTKEEIEEIP